MVLDVLDCLRMAVRKASAAEFLEADPASIEDLLTELNGITTEKSELSLAKTFIDVAGDGFKVNCEGDFVPCRHFVSDGWEILNDEEYWNLALRFFDLDDHPYPLYFSDIDKIEDIDDFIRFLKNDM